MKSSEKTNYNTISSEKLKIRNETGGKCKKVGKKMRKYEKKRNKNDIVVAKTQRIRQRKMKRNGRNGVIINDRELSCYRRYDLVTKLKRKGEKLTEDRDPRREREKERESVCERERKKRMSIL